MKKIDLSGIWSLHMEAREDGKGVCEESFGSRYQLPEEFEDTIELPGTTSYRKKGQPNSARETGYLTDAYLFLGFCVVQKEIDLTAYSLEELQTSFLSLKLERTRLTHVWVDGEYIGTGNSLLSAQEFNLTGKIKKTKPVLTILVSNVGYPAPGGHLTSPDTQTNWNGILGEISLIISQTAFVRQIQAFYREDKNALEVRAFLGNKAKWQEDTSLQVSFDRCSLKKEFLERESDCTLWEEEGLGHPEKTTDLDSLMAYLEVEKNALPMVINPLKPADCAENCGQVCDPDEVLWIPLPREVSLWDDQEPVVYRLTAQLVGKDKEQLGLPATAWCGIRSFCSVDDHFEINHAPVFLRGRHQGMIFPLSGFAPMNAQGWLRDMKIAKDWGINHQRFHTCCPPEAAFLAADLLGVYLQPEIPFWGNWYGKGEEGYTPEAEAAQEFLTMEGFRTLASYAGHPSYVMMTMGNEPWGSGQALNELELGYKAKYPDILYSLGSNGFQFVPTIVEGDGFFSGVRFSKDRLIRGSYAQCDAPLGHIQKMQPNTSFTYDENIRPSYAKQAALASEDGFIEIQYGTGVKKVKLTEAAGELVPKIPVVSHEVGQYCVYPDYREIDHYTGVCKPRNLEVFRERLEAAKLGDMGERFFQASGKLAMDCYKAELETAMRSRYLAGYQILDLQDFSGQGTALVGPLNALMESKGILEPCRWRSFCDDIVLQACFDSFVLTEGETFLFSVDLAYYRKELPENSILFIQLIDPDKKEMIWEYNGETDAIYRGRQSLGEFRIAIPEGKAPAKYRLTLALGVEREEKEDSMPEILQGNEYTLWAYPKPSESKQTICVCKSMDEARKASETEKKILLMLAPNENPNSVEGAYCTDFWCYPMFRGISEWMKKPVPVGTLGLLIQKDHRALSDFLCEEWSTPQWFHIVEQSRSTILDELPFEPIVWTIDNFERNHKLGLVYEVVLEKTGCHVLVCGADLDAVAKQGHIEAAQLKKSLLEYLAEGDKTAATTICEEAFQKLFEGTTS